MLIIETITWKPHIETAIEIAFDRVESGEDVFYVNLREGLPVCEDRSFMHFLVDLPRIRMKSASRLLSNTNIEVVDSEYGDDVIIKAEAAAKKIMGDCHSIDDVKKIKYEEFDDIGWGVLSSLISITRNSRIDFNKNKRAIFNYFKSSLMVYLQVQKLIEQYDPDEVLLFNGRFATTRAVLRAADSMGRRSWMIHERGCDKDHYWIGDVMPHDNVALQKRINDAWRPELIEDGRRFFQARRDRVERHWHVHTLKQEKGKLPREFNKKSKWVIFFTSSEDEMVAIGDKYINHHFPDQILAIQWLSSIVQGIDGLKMCVRVHPNIASKGASDRSRWDEMEVPDSVLIRSDDDIDTYALIDNSHVVCTYGSTVGVEATYWGKPSLLLANAAYDCLDVAMMAESESQVEAYLRAPFNYPQKNAIKYGAYYEAFGTKYRFYKADTLHRGSLKGVYLDDNIAIKSYRFMLNILNKCASIFRA